MARRYLLGLVLAMALFLPATLHAAELSVPQVTRNGDDIYVSVNLALDDNLTAEIKKGVEKKLIFHVDLFRAWYKWPDEFVLGKKIERNIKCDDIKGEYTITSVEWGGGRKTERFSGCDELLADALVVRNLKLVNMRGFQRGRYMVKVTAESRIRNLPPFIRQMFFFVKDVEFRVRQQSPVMRLGDK